MEFKNAKKLIKKIGVNSWFEAGRDVIKVGDKLLNESDSFSRLDYYAKHNGIEFCDAKELKIPCGEVELKDGTILYYNVISGM